MLELNTSYRDLIMIIELNGALDSRTGFDFYEFITEKILEGKLYFALDCANLEFLSSGGISSIVGIHNVLKKRDELITLFRVRKEIFQLVEFLNLQETIAIHEGSSDALNWIKRHQEKQHTDKSKAEPHASIDFFSTENRKPQKSFDMNLNVKEKTNDIVYENSQEKAERFLVKEEKKVKEENVSPSIEKEKTSEKEFSKIIYCSHCGKKLLVKRNGKHMCPVCQHKFYYPPKD